MPMRESRGSTRTRLVVHLGGLHPKARGMGMSMGMAFLSHQGSRDGHELPCSTCCYREEKEGRVTRITKKPFAKF